MIITHSKTLFFTRHWTVKVLIQDYQVENHSLLPVTKSARSGDTSKHQIIEYFKLEIDFDRTFLNGINPVFVGSLTIRRLGISKDNR